jgi:uncharacterized membrane protein
MIRGALLAVHLLSAVLWVGGMAFALMVLRPSLTVLESAQRLALHVQVFRRFFRIVWHAMPLLLLTGYGMLFGVFGGFAGVNWAVHVMHFTGLLMAALFLLVFWGPWRGLRAALRDGDTARAAVAVARLRRLILVNLLLGVITVAVAAFA